MSSWGCICLWKWLTSASPSHFVCSNSFWALPCSLADPCQVPSRSSASETCWREAGALVTVRDEKKTLHYITLHYTTYNANNTYNTNIHTYIQTNIHTYRQTDKQTNRHTDIHLHTFTYIYIHLHTFTYTYIHLHTYIQTYIHTDIQTYIHT